MCACVRVCVCACVRVCMWACGHVCMCACVHVCMCACVHACATVRPDSRVSQALLTQRQLQSRQPAFDDHEAWEQCWANIRAHQADDLDQDELQASPQPAPDPPQPHPTPIQAPSPPVPQAPPSPSQPSLPFHLIGPCPHPAKHPTPFLSPCHLPAVPPPTIHPHPPPHPRRRSTSSARQPSKTFSRPCANANSSRLASRLARAHLPPMPALPRYPHRLPSRRPISWVDPRRDRCADPPQAPIAASGLLPPSPLKTSRC